MTGITGFVTASMLLASVAFAAPGKSPVVKLPLQGLPTWEVSADRSTGAVEFDALGRPSALKIKGKGAAPKGRLKIEGFLVSGALVFDLDSLTTGIKLRDEHMKKKYLETEKFPKAILTFANLKLPDSIAKEVGTADNVPFEGNLSLHGVDRKVSGIARVDRKRDHLAVVAAFPIKTSEFGISTPSFAGITMGEDVNVSVDMSTPLLQKSGL